MIVCLHSFALAGGKPFRTLVRTSFRSILKTIVISFISVFVLDEGRPTIRFHFLF